MKLRVESFHVTFQLQNFFVTFFIETSMRAHNTQNIEIHAIQRFSLLFELERSVPLFVWETNIGRE